jgi:hypothetical protein
MVSCIPDNIFLPIKWALNLNNCLLRARAALRMRAAHFGEEGQAV